MIEQQPYLVPQAPDVILDPTLVGVWQFIAIVFAYVLLIFIGSAEITTNSEQLSFTHSNGKKLREDIKAQYYRRLQFVSESRNAHLLEGIWQNNSISNL